MHSRIALRSVCAAFALALASLLAPSSAANPAALAATSYVVNDTVGDCDANVATHATIQSAVDAALANNVKTILVCPGTYDEFNVIGAKSLTIKAALAGTFPKVYALYAPSGEIILVQDSSGVVLDGLKIDGAGFNVELTGFAYGVYFHNASGIVQNSIVTHMRCYPDVCGYGYGIFLVDDNDNGKVSTLAVMKVNITDIDQTGVHAEGPAKLTVSGSRIAGNLSGAGTALSGVTFGDGGTTGSVMKSTIHGVQTGVVLNGASKVTVSGNTIGDAWNGLLVNANCFSGNASSSNKVTGNTFFNLSQKGVLVSNTFADCTHTDKNTISDNRLIGKSGSADGVYFDVVVGAFAAKNKISGNTFFGFSNDINLGSATATSVSGNTWLP